MIITRITQENIAAFEPLAPAGMFWVDVDISCGTEENGEIRGLFLMKRQLSGVLEPVFLHGSRERKADIAAMLQFAAIRAFLKYSMDTPVHIVCRSDVSPLLVERLFPDQEPLVVRHGEAVAGFVSAGGRPD